MENEEDMNIELLQEQLKWVKEQDHILKEIELKLYKMKEIAEYAADNKLNSTEINKLNNQIAQLKIEVEMYERQLDSFH